MQGNVTNKVRFLNFVSIWYFDSLDTTNTKAVQGLQRVENSSDSLDVGMDEDGDAVEESSEEAEFDTSDTVGAWTETEVKMRWIETEVKLVWT